MSEGNTSWTIPPATTIRAYRLFNITNYMNIMTEEGNTLMEFAETEPLHYKYVESLINQISNIFFLELLLVRIMSNG